MSRFNLINLFLILDTNIYYIKRCYNLFPHSFIPSFCSSVRACVLYLLCFCLFACLSCSQACVCILYRDGVPKNVFFPFFLSCSNNNYTWGGSMLTVKNIVFLEHSTQLKTGGGWGVCAKEGRKEMFTSCVCAYFRVCIFGKFSAKICAITISFLPRKMQQINKYGFENMYICSKFFRAFVMYMDFIQGDP